jgi:hypothetical protein
MHRSHRGSGLHGAITLALACLVVAGAASLGTATTATGAAESGTATSSRPTLTFANSGTQATLGAAYTKALTNLLDTNTVPYDPSVYNTSGLMTSSPGTFVRAGGGYAQPWTRDATVNSWNAASVLEPAVAANTLWSVVVRQPDGQLLLQQDNETWDEVVSMTGAWNHYLVTGDQTFLANAYQTAVNTLDLRKSQVFNSSYGLFEGPAFFNDGIAGYPAPPADATESQGSYVGSYTATSTMMTLSTNELYYSAYRSTALMAQALGQPSGTVAALNSSADALKTSINQYLWNPGRGTYGYFIHGDDSAAGQVDQTEEGTGLAFAILFGIANSSQTQSILQNTHVQPYGVADTYPNFARYSDSQPGRHNVIVWPMVQGFWADAAASAGNQSRFANEVQNLAGLANAGNQFAEIYNAQTGAVDGGWQTGGHWSAAPDQTWSATAFLRTMYTDTFGMKYGTGGLTFQPTLPAGWGDATLTGMPYRNATLSITLHGSGNVISTFKLDGTTTTNTTLPTTLTGNHTVDITLTGAQPTPAIGTIVSGLASSECVDISNNSSTWGTPVQMWGCNNTGAQVWSLQPDGTVHINGNCLDIKNGSTANGTPVQEWGCDNTGAQQWSVSGNTLVNPASGKCLDDPGSSTSWGVQLDIQPCGTGANERWAIP